MRAVTQSDVVTCERKKTYRSPDTALRIAATLTGLGFYGKKHRVYECHCCKLWHITTSTPPK